MACNVCDDAIQQSIICDAADFQWNGEKFDRCLDCGVRSRTRMLKLLLDTSLRDQLGVPNRNFKSLLVSGTKIEVYILEPYLKTYTTSSLYGNYSARHVKSDLTDLKEFQDQDWDLVFHSYVMDYVSDGATSLKNQARILRPNGFLLFHISDRRLSDDRNAPVTIRYRDTFSAKYYPQGTLIPSVRYGREWILEELKRNGMEPREHVTVDPFHGDRIIWYCAERVMPSA